MEGISDIKIVAIDSKRPPVIRKQPYIDLIFELSHKVPKAWSEDFNSLLSKVKFTARIETEEGLYIETWVRSPDDVVEHFALLNQKVAECNERYIAKIVASQGKKEGGNSAAESESGEQGRLNRIISGLEFVA